EMQYNLLVHRFGFNPTDVLKLTDDDSAISPSRENILQAFETHLIQQAQPGDVVVIHYSGHGSLVADPDPVLVAACRQNSSSFNNDGGLNGTLVPNNPTAANQTGPDIIVPDIMGRSLFLLMERINTENLTLVLDSCYSGAGTRGNASVRAVNSRLGRSGESFMASPEEFENQARWLKDLNMTSEEFHDRRARGVAKGVALGSASCDQEAVELPIDDHQHSGIFTYLLTSYLWQLPWAEPAETLQANLIRSTLTTVTKKIQIPIFEYKPDSQNNQQPLYFSELSAPFAAGVVTNVPGEGIEVWLGGVSSQNIKTASPGTVYALFNGEGQEVANLVLESRAGLVGTGRLAAGQSVAVKTGMLLREKVLAIPNPTLRVGVDPSLGADVAQAQAALQATLATTTPSGQTVGWLSVLPVDQQSDIEYLLGRTTPEIQQLLRNAGDTAPPPVGTIALFAPDLSSVVPQTFGATDEIITATVERLRPRLKSLLAGRVLRELATVTTAEFNVAGEVIDGGGRGVSIPIAGSQGGSARSGRGVMVSTEPFYTNEEIKIRVKNREAKPVYLCVLGIGNDGKIQPLQPANWDAPEEASRVARGEEITVPAPEDRSRFSLSGSGYVELITLVSHEPLRALLQSLQTIARGAGISRGFVDLEEDDTLDVVAGLLGDLDAASRSANNGGTGQTTAGTSAVDSRTIAVFSTVIEVVENPNGAAN
ncbi:MAG: DUF4384 domain-containing protein, partial [Nodosilinea sp.]